MKNDKISIIGLGYVGLPLAVEFSKKYSTVGYDISKNRVFEINNFYDSTQEIEEKELKKVVVKSNLKGEIGLFVTINKNHISDSNIYIITVPTPIDINNEPDLNPIISATKLVAGFLKKMILLFMKALFTLV